GEGNARLAYLLCYYTITEGQLSQRNSLVHTLNHRGYERWTHRAVVGVVLAGHHLGVAHERLPLAHGGPGELELPLHGAPQRVAGDIGQSCAVEDSTHQLDVVVPIGLRRARRGEDVLDPIPLLRGPHTALQRLSGTTADGQRAEGEVALADRIPD